VRSIGVDNRDVSLFYAWIRPDLSLRGSSYVHTCMHFSICALYSAFDFLSTPLIFIRPLDSDVRRRDCAIVRRRRRGCSMCCSTRRGRRLTPARPRERRRRSPAVATTCGRGWPLYLSLFFFLPACVRERTPKYGIKGAADP
jgi:hypothetical protein